MRKPKKYALHLGVDQLENNHYGGELSHYSSADSTAGFYEKFFCNIGFDKSIYWWRPQQKTTLRFKNQIIEWAEELDHGDMLVITFTGHGYKMDKEVQTSLNYKNDRGWRFYDRILFFIELWQWARLFRAGVDIIVIADSCYAGPLDTEPGMIGPLAAKKNLIERWPETYDPILSVKSRPLQHQVPASLLILSSSTRDTEALPCVGHSLTVFAWAFQKAWEEGKVGNDQNFFSFYEKIKKWVLRAIGSSRPK